MQPQSKTHSQWSYSSDGVQHLLGRYSSWPPFQAGEADLAAGEADLAAGAGTAATPAPLAADSPSDWTSFPERTAAGQVHSAVVESVWTSLAGYFGSFGLDSSWDICLKE